MLDAGTRRNHITSSIDEPNLGMMEDSFTMDIEPDNDVVSVILTRDMIVRVIGKHTGRLYVFSGAGSVVDNVDRLDAETMLQKGLNRSCCGTQSTPYFQILGR